MKKIIKITPTLLNYFRKYGVSVPHFCYHKNLIIDGNCRICMIEIENSTKSFVSCASTSMAVLTSSVLYNESPFLKKAKENGIELLLVNHPLDCPICDQGGDCDLQDQSLFFGIIKRRFFKLKRATYNKNIGSIIKTSMSKCIHCTRCIRFSIETTGLNYLGILNRGIFAEISNYIFKNFVSEFAGNIIDLCPVSSFCYFDLLILSRNIIIIVLGVLGTVGVVGFSSRIGYFLYKKLRKNFCQFHFFINGSVTVTNVVQFREYTNVYKYVEGECLIAPSFTHIKLVFHTSVGVDFKIINESGETIFSGCTKVPKIYDTSFKMEGPHTIEICENGKKHSINLIVLSKLQYSRVLKIKNYI